MTSPEKISSPELRELSLAKERQEVFSESSDKRLGLMRELFNSLSPATPLRIIRTSQDDKKDVLLRDSTLRSVDYLGSGDVLTLVSNKNITGNKNGYSYLHHTVEINGAKVNKIYVKVKTSTGQIGYVALEHIGKAETKVNGTPTTTDPEAKLDRGPTIPTQKTETIPAPIPVQTPEMGKEKLISTTTITSLPSGLRVARGPNQSTHPLIAKEKMADMIITYEGPGGERQPDTGGTSVIGGGINTGGPVLERRYALGENYEKWNSNFIPVNEVKGAVEKTLEARIARTYESCKNHEIDFDALPLFAQKVLVDLHYNMNSIQSDFPKFWQAIKEKNWKEAGKQLMDSGKGYPNSYLTDVYTRAYANAMMLSKGNANGAEEYKNEATKILGGTRNAYLLYNAYFQETGKYGKHLGWREKREISKETPDPVQFANAILSDEILRGIKSTATIQSLLQKHLQNNPGNRDVLVAEFRKRLGDFNGPLDTGEKIASYQVHAYLTNPEAFKTDIKFIDGEYGEKTKLGYLKDYYEEKGSEIVGKIQDVNTIQTLSPFEKSVLTTSLPKITDGVNPNSPENIIRLAQIMVALDNIENKDLSLKIDGKWSIELEKLLNSLPSSSSKEVLSTEKVLKILSKKYEVKGNKNSMLEGLRGCAVRGAMNLASELGNPGDLVITGGTEGGHSRFSFGSAEFTHGGGYKLDLRVTSGLKEYTGLNSGEKVEKIIKGQKVLFYRHGPNDHFDVTFYPTS